MDVPSTSSSSSGGKKVECPVEALGQTLKDLAIGSQKGCPHSGSSSAAGGSPVKEKMMLRPEPCFLQGLRSGASPLSSKK